MEVTNPDKEMFPDPGYTKRDLVGYYERMADRMLPGSPAATDAGALPDGVGAKGFMQKNASRHFSDHIGRVEVPKSDGTVTTRRRRRRRTHRTGEPGHDRLPRLDRGMPDLDSTHPPRPRPRPGGGRRRRGAPRRPAPGTCSDGFRLDGAGRLGEEGLPHLGADRPPSYDDVATAARAHRRSRGRRTPGTGHHRVPQEEPTVGSSSTGCATVGPVDRLSVVIACHRQQPPWPLRSTGRSSTIRPGLLDPGTVGSTDGGRARRLTRLDRGAIVSAAAGAGVDSTPSSTVSDR
jgi:hypothetical protein